MMTACALAVTITAWRGSTIDAHTPGRKPPWNMELVTMRDLDKMLVEIAVSNAFIWVLGIAVFAYLVWMVMP